MGKETIRPVNVLKVSYDGKAHIHKLIVEGCGGGRIIPYVISGSTVLLYDPKLNLREILESIDVLKQTVKLRVLRTEKGPSE